MTARREFGAVIVACVAGAALVLLALRQGWARVDYAAPKPLPSGSIAVSGQNLLPAAGALALAALACLAAIIATRGLARRVAGLAMAGLGAWIAAEVSQPVDAATVIAAASGQAISGGLGGSLPGGNSTISGNSPTGGGLPEIGAASRVVLDSMAWRPLALIGAVAVIAAGLLAAWRGPRWAVMSARFDRPAQQEVPATLAPGAAAALTPPGALTGPAPVSAPAPAAAPAPAPAPAAAPAPAPAGSAAETGAVSHPAPGGTEASAAPPDSDRDAAALWEALDRGVDLTDTAEAEPEPVTAPARGEEQ